MLHSLYILIGQAERPRARTFGGGDWSDQGTSLSYHLAPNYNVFGRDLSYPCPSNGGKRIKHGVQTSFTITYVLMLQGMIQASAGL